MARLTLAYAAILIVLGLVAYFVLQPAGDRSATALIPAFFGIVFALLGGLALNARFRKHAMHGAAILALLVIVPTAGSIPQLPAALEASGQPAAPAPAADEADVPDADDAAGAADAAGEAAAEEAEEEPIRAQAVIVQAITCVLSIAFLAACVVSFVQARRGGDANAGAGPA